MREKGSRMCVTLLVTVAAAFVLLANTAVRAEDDAEPSLFAQLNFPSGATTDSNGNVFVFHTNSFLSQAVTAFAPNGTALASFPLNTLLFGRLATDYATGNIWVFLSDSTLLVLNPATGQYSPIGKLCDVPTDANQVFDAATGTFRAFSQLAPCLAEYGDIALLRRGDYLDIYISGHYVIHPFITRLRFFQGNFVSARVMITSLAPLSPELNEPRGVTINNQNIVMTTMPVTGRGEFVYVFSGDYTEGATPGPTALFGGISSLGLATDAAGNFFISSYLSGACQVAEDLIIVPVSLDLQGAACFGRGDQLARFSDVTVPLSGDPAYLPSGFGNAVLRWTLSGGQQDLSPVTISLGSSEALGGWDVPATITLIAPAGPGGDTIPLVSSNTSLATVPAQVTIPEGQSSASFYIRTKPVQTARDVEITASYLTDYTVTLTVKPVRSRQFLPSSLSLP